MDALQHAHVGGAAIVDRCRRLDVKQLARNRTMTRVAPTRGVGLVVRSPSTFCGWSLLCHGTAEKWGGVTSGCAKPHLIEGKDRMTPT